MQYDRLCTFALGIRIFPFIALSCQTVDFLHDPRQLILPSLLPAIILSGFVLIISLISLKCHWLLRDIVLI